MAGVHDPNDGPVKTDEKEVVEHVDSDSGQPDYEGDAASGVEDEDEDCYDDLEDDDTLGATDDTE